MHAGYQHLERTNKAVVGMSIQGKIPQDVHCDACIRGKMHVRPYRTAESRSTKILAHMSFDLVFPPKTIPSLGGATAFLGLSVRTTGLKLGYAIK